MQLRVKVPWFSDESDPTMNSSIVNATTFALQEIEKTGEGLVCTYEVPKMTECLFQVWIRAVWLGTLPPQSWTKQEPLPCFKVVGNT